MQKKVQEGSKLFLLTQGCRAMTLLCYRSPTTIHRLEEHTATRDVDFGQCMRPGNSESEWHCYSTRDWALRINRRAEQMDDCIQMAQAQTSLGLIQLINVYVMTEED